MRNNFRFASPFRDAEIRVDSVGGWIFTDSKPQAQFSQFVWPICDQNPQQTTPSEPWRMGKGVTTLKNRRRL
jgi:hypothetical protein